MKEQNNCALAGKATSVDQGVASSKAEEWRVVDSTIGQLLLLLSQRAAHDVLVRKVETLHSQVRGILAKPRPKGEAGKQPLS